MKILRAHSGFILRCRHTGAVRTAESVLHRELRVWMLSVSFIQGILYLFTANDLMKM